METIPEGISYCQYKIDSTCILHKIDLVENIAAYIQPICLPTSAHDQSQEFLDKQLTVSGWGETEDSNHTSSSEKMKVNVGIN